MELCVNFQEASDWWFTAATEQLGLQGLALWF